MKSCKYTIVGMQNEKSFYSHYNEFEYNHDYEKVTMTKCYIITCARVFSTI